MTSSFAKNDEARHLARLGLAAFPLTPASRLAVQHAVAVEEAWAKLAAVAGPEHLDSLRPEVERRERIFREHRRRLPHSGEHPTLAALHSVTGDVALGRL